jgi:hypothetical protein
MMTLDELRTTITRLNELRAKHNRADRPFEIQAVCVDRFGVDGYREQAAIGVTDAITVPWLAYGVGFDASIEEKQACLRRFAADVIERV